MTNNIKSFSDIINTSPTNNFKTPSIQDITWRQVNNRNYKTIKSNQIYKINSQLLDIINNFTQIYKSLKIKHNINLTSTNITTLFIIRYDKTKESHIIYTNLNILVFIKHNLFKYNTDQDSVFDMFDTLDKNPDFTKFNFEIIEYIKNYTKQDVLERKQIYYNLLFKQNTSQNNNQENSQDITQDLSLDKIYVKRIQLYHDLIYKQLNSFRSFTSFIYILNNIFNNKKFILGYHKKLTDTEIFDIAVNSSKFKAALLTHSRRSFNITTLETFKAKNIIDLILRIDFLKIKYNTINNGYNDNFSILESQQLYDQTLLTKQKNIILRNLFIRSQLILLEDDKTFTNNNINYQDVYQYAYMITNKRTRQKYVGFSYNNTAFKKYILEFYNKALSGNIKQNKLLKNMSEAFYNDLDFKIIKIKTLEDTKIDIQDYVNKMIIKYNTKTAGLNN